MPNVRCFSCKKVKQLPDKSRMYILDYSKFVCSWACLMRWTQKQIPLNGKYTPAQMWGAYTINEERTYPDFRSAYENLVSRALDASKVEWQFERWLFELDHGTYTPDFWLPKYGCFLEVKGLWWTAQRNKFNRFREQFPKVPILLANYLLKRDIEKIIPKLGGAEKWMKNGVH